MPRHLPRLVAIIAAATLTLAATDTERASPEDPAAAADNLPRSTTYGPGVATEGPTPQAAARCTVSMDNLRIIGTQAVSHLEQLCSRWVTQRLSKHNWQRKRWWGWETLVWNEPATEWTYADYIDDYEYFSCIYGSGRYTYRSIGQGQFRDPVTGELYTSGYVVSNTWRKTC